MATDMEVDKPTLEDLFGAAERGDVDFFTSLSQEELNRSRTLRNEDGRSLLHVAAAAGQSEVYSTQSLLPTLVRVFMSTGSGVSEIDSKDEEGWAPIHSASSSGNIEIVEILLDKGSNINLANNGGRTALHYAASKGWIKMAEMLISRGAKINAKDKVGCTPLHRAASIGNAELCELLIEEGADVDAVDRTGQTPLMNAVICENKQVALLLIRHGADVDCEDREGYTVLGRATADFRPALIDAAKAMLEC